MKSRRHRAIYWAKVGKKKKSNVLDRMESIIFKPMEYEPHFDIEILVIDEPEPDPKPNPIENFKNAMISIAKRAKGWKLWKQQ